MGNHWPIATVILLNPSQEVGPATTELQTQPGFVASAATDVNGTFMFFDVPQSKLRLEVSKPGFNPKDQDLEFSGTPLSLHIEGTHNRTSSPELIS
jgi:hypothetical protein